MTRPATTTSTTMLPTIDFAPGAHSNPGAALDHSLHQLGFAQVSNIGIDQQLLAQVFATSREFFLGPQAAKDGCRYRSAAENFGYQGLFDENLDPDAPADIKESLTLRNIIHQPPSLERWPSPAFRDLMQAFFADAFAAAKRLQVVIAEQLGVAGDYFTRRHCGECTSLRLLYYPHDLQHQLQAGQLGAGAHCDYGFITLLFQDEIGGLQVQNRQGAWLNIPPQAGSVVINSGDLLERWSNGRYRSTPHRVEAKLGQQARQSIALFVDPDSSTLVAPLPTCTGPDNPARYPPITAAEHLHNKLSATHKQRFEA
ncbi:isopenicillin N synthase family dioxygenase [Halioxenophilus sp. WMMB6]|uniref:isopenicillin N synthase family dioxygenase n=1 Tax=Halioxenophilus sp. WMMB6 TaxID=3073815 RepID=UPI00295ECE0C|nr:2OG-Fe(II) oxygenase family protein [Halioxenophilus sp. WMMB6]